MPRIRRVLITAVTASVLLAGGTGIAAASPNGQHPDLLETDTYCGPGMRWPTRRRPTRGGWRRPCSGWWPWQPWPSNPGAEAGVAPGAPGATPAPTTTDPDQHDT
jgi:hypothetical protein